jgi:hypothetical protein
MSNTSKLLTSSGSTARTIRWRHLRRQQTGWHRQPRRSPLHRPRPVNKVDRGYLTLPQSQHQGMLLQYWRSSPSSYPKHEKTTQGPSLVSKVTNLGSYHLQLMERRPAVSLLHVVPRLLIYRSSLYGYLRTLHCKWPSGPSTGLGTSLNQDPALTATHGSCDVHHLRAPTTVYGPPTP